MTAKEQFEDSQEFKEALQTLPTDIKKAIGDYVLPIKMAFDMGFIAGRQQTANTAAV